MWCSVYIRYHCTDDEDDDDDEEGGLDVADEDIQMRTVFGAMIRGE